MEDNLDNLKSAQVSMDIIIEFLDNMVICGKIDTSLLLLTWIEALT